MQGLRHVFHACSRALVRTTNSNGCWARATCAAAARAKTMAGKQLCAVKLHPHVPVEACTHLEDEEVAGLDQDVVLLQPPVVLLPPHRTLVQLVLPGRAGGEGSRAELCMCKGGWKGTARCAPCSLAGIAFSPAAPATLQLTQPPSKLKPQGASPGTAWCSCRAGKPAWPGPPVAPRR